MGRDFTSASSQRIDYNTTLANFERTQAFSVAFMYNAKSNNAGTVFSKYDVTGVARGWEVFLRNGTSTPTVALELVNVNATSKAATHTTAEFSLNAWHKVVITYDGLSAEAGIIIYVDSTTPQAKVPLADNLSGTILNSITSQSGARNGTSAPAQFLNGLLRRLCLYNLVLSAQDISDFMAAAPNDKVPYGSATATSQPDKTKLLLWQEFGPSNDGATVVSDWSGNSNIGVVTGAIYSVTDPTVTNLLPNVGTAGAATLSGPLTRTTLASPLLQNLGWVLGTNSGLSDQIGPGIVIKAGTGDYRGWFENASNQQTLNPPNQAAGQNDTPSTYATSTNGTTWTIQNQDVPGSAIFNVNNVSTNLTAPQLATFLAAASAETSISDIIRIPGGWRAFFHCGNNAPGVRRVYSATNLIDPATANWNIDNNGVATIDVGAGGSWDEHSISDLHVVQISPTLLIGIYDGRDASVVARVGQVTSTDYGLTWTKYVSNPVMDLGAAGAFDDKNVLVGSLIYDSPTNSLITWYGAQSNAVAIRASIGFASATLASQGTVWTKGSFNPVLNSFYSATADANIDKDIAGTIGTYLDGNVYRNWYQADNGVSGAPGFRGRQEAIYTQIVAATASASGGGASKGIASGVYFRRR